MCNKLIALLLISTQAFAGLPPTTIQGQSDSSSKVKSSFQVPHNQATDLGGVKSLIETGNGNILPDPGFEAATSGWTASGGATATSNSTAKGTGSLGYDWDSNAASQTLMSTSVTIPNGLQSKNGVASCQIKTVSGTATHTLVVNDGTNDIGTPLTVGSSTTSFQETKINFVFPASGTIRLKLASVASNEPEIYIDDCKISLADNVYEAPIVGPWESYTPTFTGFGTVTNIECKSRRNGENRDVDCKFTTGTTTATEARISLPNSLISAGTSLIPSIRKIGDVIFSGTGTVADVIGSSFAVLGEPSVNYVTFGTRYSGGSALTKTFGTTFASSASHSVNFSIPIAGYSAISAQSADQTDYGDTAYTPTFTGLGTVTGIECFHSRVSDKLKIACKAVTGTPTATEARVSLPNSLVSGDTSKIPSIRIAGFGGENSTGASPIVGATHSVLIEPSVSYVTFGFRNGSQGALTKVTGSAGFTGSTAFSFSAEIPIQGWQANGRASTLNGSVTSNAQNAERIERITAVNGSACSITRQSGSWVTSLTSCSTGSTTYNFTGFSAAPSCVCVDHVSADRNCSITSQTTTSVTVVTQNSGAAADMSMSMICMGPR